MKSLSAPPSMVSGDDVLLQVDVPAGSDPAKVSVLLNGDDVTDKFLTKPDENARIGLMDKSGPKYTLRPGSNRVVARYDVNKGSDVDKGSGELTLTNHPVSGPVFSGPQERPFVCETASFALPDDSRLGNPLNWNVCSTSTRTHHVYWSTSQQRFIHMATPNSLPGDAGWITVDGRNVRFVVRIETGTINRAIYQIAILHNPAADDPPSPFAQPSGWNRKLVYSFGGGCSAGWYRQGTEVGWNSGYYDANSPMQLLDPELLRRGFAIASSTLNVFAQNCNEVLAAETMAMVKEHFIEAYGVPRYTLGWGCSGGAYQEYQIADNYPGLLDGVIAGCSYPEVSFTTVHFMSDARLLNRYFNGAYHPGPGLSDAQQRAVSGMVSTGTLQLMDDGAADRIGVADCPSVLPWEDRYRLGDNPDGARCGVFDHAVNVWGTRPNPLNPAYTIARRPLDNTGVQYGLKALNSGTIDVDQFLDLNERIGGFDSEGNPTAEWGTVPAPRSVADTETLPIAYESGRMLYGGWGLKHVPIIDYRVYEDSNPGGGFHLRYHSFVIRERLLKANGTAANHVMLLEGSAPLVFSSQSPLVRHALDQMDLWLTAILADSTTDTQAVKVARHRPAALREGCVPPGSGYPDFRAETLTPGSGTCASWYPVSFGTRAAAGAPAVLDVAKCQLKTVDTALADGTYAVSFTPGQRNWLRSIFPSGVCDWSKPAVGQPSAAEYQSLQPWQTFD
ncbi:MAG: hypothetical protein AMXMBFR52_29490 [Burkholderiales bacterium]